MPVGLWVPTRLVRRCIHHPVAQLRNNTFPAAIFYLSYFSDVAHLSWCAFHSLFSALVRNQAYVCFDESAEQNGLRKLGKNLIYRSQRRLCNDPWRFRLRFTCTESSEMMLTPVVHSVLI